MLNLLDSKKLDVSLLQQRQSEAYGALKRNRAQNGPNQAAQRQLILTELN